MIDPSDVASKRFSRLFLKNGASRSMLQTFHALRGTKIEYDRLLKVDTRVIQKQVGHEFDGVHESYGAPVLTPPEIDQVANLPLPKGIDWSMFKGLNFDKMAAVRPTVGRPRRPK
jgi:integrase